MVDIVDPATRSRMMSGIRGRDTAGERFLRSYLHRSGLRFRVNDSRLPGRPDLVFPAHATVVFVHGCFWHRHRGCPLAAVPSTRRMFWLGKFASNVERDRRTARMLRAAGWQVLVVWECQISVEAAERLFFRIVTNGGKT